MSAKTTLERPRRRAKTRTRRKLLLIVLAPFLLMSAILAFLVAYAVGWAVVYRLPREPVKVIDMRRSTNDKGCYLTFCGSLAANPHGFPGHAYVVWTRTYPSINNVIDDSAGFVPHWTRDQVASLFRPVPGLLTGNAQEGNLRNLDELVVILSPDEYEMTKRMRNSWKGDTFQVGVCDCVHFVDSIATSIGLRPAPTRYVFPQDYIRDLKRAN